ncbi:hypothetical protein [uncultured Eudoraea sp.]|uniref:hypothetical protein n=1 Tax=uncultured Eudoraea sp. TaxID=1035614 RepID=UPI00260E4B9E|nr:hypothetical protein [uncultured Eudoraea sp.]
MDRKIRNASMNVVQSFDQTTYSGTASDYIKEIIIPSLPKVDDIISFTESLYSYLNDVNKVRYIRKFKSYPHRGNIYNEWDRTFTVTDNEPALWFYMECFEEKISDFSSYEENKSFPIAFALKSEEKKYSNDHFRYGKNSRENLFSSSGLKHCHILECAPRGESLEELSIDSRMIRLLSPMNHFPFPSPRKYEMSSDFGEDYIFLNLVKKILYQEYYKTSIQKEKFIEFLEAAGNKIKIINIGQDMLIKFSSKLSNQRLVVKKVKTTKQPTTSVEFGSSNNDHRSIASTILSHYKISEKDYGKGLVIRVKFKRGKYQSSIFEYDHDYTYEKVIDHLKTLSCWEKYSSYYNTSNIPGFAKKYVKNIE